MDAETNNIYEFLTKTRELDLSRISSLDSTTFTIKGWAITLVTAIIGLALQYHSRQFLYIGMITTAFFATIDFFYRKVQLLHVERVLKIERYLESRYITGIEELKDLSKSFHLNGKRNFSRNYLLPVLLVYLVMEIALIVLIPLVRAAQTLSKSFC